MFGFDVFSILLVALILLLSSVLLNWSGINKNLPPGPRGWPLIGYAFFLGKQKALWIAAKQISNEYQSDIVHFSLLGIHFVFLNSYDLIKDAFSKREEFSDKPKRSLMKILDSNYKGLIESSGSFWKEQRRFTLSLLRDFGMGKTRAENFIHEEINYLSERILLHHGEAFDPLTMFTPAVSNVTNLMVFGQRFEYGDREFNDTLCAIDELVASFTEAYVGLRMTPYIGWMAKYLMPKTDRELCKNYKKWKDFIRKQISQHLETFDGNVEDFIDGFLAESKKRKDDKDNTFTLDQLQFLVMDLFVAGSETTTTTLRWAILYLIKHIELQEKIFQELMDTIGKERLPSMSDKKNTPLTESFLLELLRFNTIAPLGGPHSCLLNGDTELHGYTIPHDAAIFGNLGAMHRDPRIFPDPDIFKPQRFFENGKVVNCEKVCPFGIGRRSCAAEGLARMEIYLFITSLVLRYRFEKFGDEELDLESNQKMIWGPKPYRVIFVQRF